MSVAPTRLVNLDYAASTPLRPEAIEAMRAYDISEIAGANPNSLHTLGRRAAQALDAARRDIARSLGTGVRPAEVVFTNGGTEADALALFGIAEGARSRDHGRTRVITSAIEHEAILDNLAQLKRRGFTVDILKPGTHGIIEPGTLDAAMGDDVALVSIMFANNETGAVQPVGELAQIAHSHGAYFHTDAIQGYLHAPIDVSVLRVDALSLAGHKVGASVASGALYLRRGVPFEPLIRGGGQEAGRRAGTQDVRSALGLAAVARTLSPRLDEDHARVLSLSGRLYERLLESPRIHATLPDLVHTDRLPGIVSILVDGCESEELILQLDVRGFCVSAVSACSSGSTDASHVLTAMGIPRERAAGSLRISFDDRVREQDLDAFADALLDLTGGARS